MPLVTAVRARASTTSGAREGVVEVAPPPPRGSPAIGEGVRRTTVTSHRNGPSRRRGSSVIPPPPSIMTRAPSSSPRLRPQVVCAWRRCAAGRPAPGPGRARRPARRTRPCRRSSALGVGPHHAHVGLDARPRQLHPADLGVRVEHGTQPRRDRRDPVHTRPSAAGGLDDGRPAGVHRLREPGSARRRARGRWRCDRARRDPRIGVGVPRGRVARFSKHLGLLSCRCRRRPHLELPSSSDVAPCLRSPRPHPVRHCLRHRARDHGPGGNIPIFLAAHQGQDVPHGRRSSPAVAGVVILAFAGRPAGARAPRDRWRRSRWPAACCSS